MQTTAMTGDECFTKTAGGIIIPKDSQLMECLGSLDELNSFIGDAKAALKCSSCDIGTIEIIDKVQKDLYYLMGFLAMQASELAVSIESINSLIDNLKTELPPTTGFIVPGENPVSAKLHIARAVCRRCERRLVSIELEGKELIIKYINRLSDLLFLLALKTASF